MILGHMGGTLTRNRSSHFPNKFGHFQQCVSFPLHWSVNVPCRWILLTWLALSFNCERSGVSGELLGSGRELGGGPIHPGLQAPRPRALSVLPGACRALNVNIWSCLLHPVWPLPELGQGKGIFGGRKWFPQNRGQSFCLSVRWDVGPERCVSAGRSWR